MKSIGGCSCDFFLWFNWHWDYCRRFYLWLFLFHWWLYFQHRLNTWKKLRRKSALLWCESLGLSGHPDSLRCRIILNLKSLSLCPFLESILIWCEIILTNCDKITNMALLCSFLDRILNLIISIMFEFDVFDVTITTNGLSICAQIPQVDELCFDMVGITSWLWGIFYELYVVLKNGGCFAVEFDFFDKFEVDVAVMLEVNVFSWPSFEFAMLDLWLLWSPWVESSQPHLGFRVSFNFAFVVLFNFINDRRVLIASSNLFIFVWANFLWSWFDFLSLCFNFRWRVDLLFWGGFDILISLPSYWLSIEAKQVINHIHIGTWLCWCWKWFWGWLILCCFLDSNWLWSSLDIILGKCHRYIFRPTCLTFLGSNLNFTFFFH